MSYKDLKKQIKKGDRLMAIAKVNSAIKRYKEALKINQNSKISCNKLADAYMKIEKYNKAIKVYKKSLELDSTDHIMYANIAFAFINIKDYKNAKICYEKALKIRPEMKSYRESLEQVNSLINEALQDDRVKDERDKLKKLKKMFLVSDKINLDILMRVLKMDQDSFEEKIFNWAKKYNFKIDKNVLVINQETVSELINDITKKISNEKIFCQFCGKQLLDKEIIQKHPIIIWKCSGCETENKETLST